MLSDFESIIQDKVAFVNTNDHQFHTKYPVYTNELYFKNALIAISVIHEFGAKKYSFYSWQNIPDKSDSCCENSLDATHRHLVRYRLDSLLDESGINHAGHIACRGGSMFLTRFYRCVMQRENFQRTITRSVPLMSTIKKLVNTDYDECNLLFTDQITPEVRLSMMKYKPEYCPTSKDVAIDLIDEAIARSYAHDIPRTFDPFNDVCWADIIFWASAYLVNLHPEIVHQCRGYMNNLTCTTEECTECTNDVAIVTPTRNRRVGDKKK